jgi:HEAT repeat protein
VRYDAAIALGILGDDRAIVPLVSLMQQPDEPSSVDSAAAMGLVRLGNRAVPALVEVLKQGTHSGRGLAASVLGSIGDTRAIEPLTALLASEDESTRIAAIEALAEIGGERCLALIRQRPGDPSPGVRENATYWVQELQTESTPK